MPYLLVLRVFLVVIPGATIALLVFSDRIDGLMPQPSFFTIPACAIAVTAGCFEVATRSGAIERRHSRERVEAERKHE